MSKEKTGNTTLTETAFDFKNVVHLSALHVSTRGLTHLALGKWMHETHAIISIHSVKKEEKAAFYMDA